MIWNCLEKFKGPQAFLNKMYLVTLLPTQRLFRGCQQKGKGMCQVQIVWHHKEPGVSLVHLSLPRSTLKASAVGWMNPTHRADGPVKSWAF